MVLRVLRNEKYCGDLLQKKYRTTDHLTHRKLLNDGTEAQFCLRDHHEAIVSREDFQAVQAELARRAALPAERRRFSARYWHSGKLRCAACGKSFTCKRTRLPGGGERLRFVCRGRLDGATGCQMPSVSGQVLLAAARHVLRQLAPDPQTLIPPLLQELQALRARDGGREAAALRQALDRQAVRRARALEAYLDGALNREDLRLLTARCEEASAQLRSQLEVLEPGGRALGEEVSFQAVRALLERELEGGESVLAELIERITVCPDHLLVEVSGLPCRFRVRARSPGPGRPVEVLECVSLPLEGDG